ANSVKSAMQAALDSTALMLSKEAATDTPAQLQANGTAYFKALFNRPDAPNPVITASYTTAGGSSVVVNGSAPMQTNFMGIFGYNTININGTSTTKWGSTRLRVALALDNTGSMSSDGKMTALKSATKSLLGQLQAAASNNGDVYVSIIPFSKDVNVGSTYYNANWIDWDDWDDDNGHDNSTQTCTSTKTGKNGKSTKKCTTTTTWVPDNHNTWNGCITDRDMTQVPNTTTDYDQSAQNPDPTVPASLFPAEQYGSCPVAMMGLNYNWASMSSLVDSMQPNGNTNQPIGLVWAWQSLVGGGPLVAPLTSSDYQYQKIIILLSDGLNTEDRWYSSQSQVDNRMYQTSNGSGTCANIKASGITIYTIQVNTGGDPTSTLLKNCASDSTKFFIVTSANQILTTFNKIGTGLTQLRVAQ
ncbi:MAG TPA: pilus assembly protein TadG, partial [Pseudolabrys sp.]